MMCHYRCGDGLDDFVVGFESDIKPVFNGGVFPVRDLEDQLDGGVGYAALGGGWGFS